MKSYSQVIGKENEENVIVCLEGDMTVNDVPLKEFNYARVLKDKVANVVIPEGAVAVHLKA